jgi:hypothetical protein
MQTAIQELHHNTLGRPTSGPSANSPPRVSACSVLCRNSFTSYLLVAIPTTHYLLLTTYYSLPTTYYPLPTSYFLLPTSYYLFPPSYYLLPATYRIRKCEAYLQRPVTQTPVFKAVPHRRLDLRLPPDVSRRLAEHATVAIVPSVVSWVVPQANETMVHPWV